MERVMETPWPGDVCDHCAVAGRSRAAGLLSPRPPCHEGRSDDSAQVRVDRRYSTGSVSDLSPPKGWLREVQVADAPRTVPVEPPTSRLKTKIGSDTINN